MKSAIWRTFSKTLMPALVILAISTETSSWAGTLNGTLLGNVSINNNLSSQRQNGTIIGAANAGGEDYYAFYRFAIGTMATQYEQAHIDSINLVYTGGGTINNSSYPSVSVARITDNTTSLNTIAPGTAFTNNFPYGVIPGSGGGISGHSIDILSLLAPNEVLIGDTLDTLTIRLKLTNPSSTEGYGFSSQYGLSLTYSLTATPEPSSVVLLLVGSALYPIIRRRQRN